MFVKLSTTYQATDNQGQPGGNVDIVNTDRIVYMGIADDGKESLIVFSEGSFTFVSREDGEKIIKCLADSGQLK